MHDMRRRSSGGSQGAARNLLDHENKSPPPPPAVPPSKSQQKQQQEAQAQPQAGQPSYPDRDHNRNALVPRRTWNDRFNDVTDGTGGGGVSAAAAAAQAVAHKLRKDASCSTKQPLFPSEAAVVVASTTAADNFPQEVHDQAMQELNHLLQEAMSQRQ